jgi:hypothetical protein
MEYAALKDALDGFYAYDSGSLDSGIHDPDLKAAVDTYLKSLDDASRKALLSRAGRDLFLSDEAIAQGYGLPDSSLFCHWLEDQNWLD